MIPGVVVGNDVVDLDEAGDAHLRERFLGRVLCEEERERVRASADPRREVWTLFAAKEAAYKVVTKVAPRAFAHREFRVAADLGSVSVGGVSEEAVVRCQLSVVSSQLYVHAVASNVPVEARAKVAEVAPGADLSLEARALLRAGLSDELGCEATELEVVRAPIEGSWDGFGPPHVTRAGRRVAADVSLSHDGRFVACAYSIRSHAGLPLSEDDDDRPRGLLLSAPRRSFVSHRDT